MFSAKEQLLNDTSREWSQNVWSLGNSSNILGSKQMSN